MLPHTHPEKICSVKASRETCGRFGPSSKCLTGLTKTPTPASRPFRSLHVFHASTTLASMKRGRGGESNDYAIAYRIPMYVTTGPTSLSQRFLRLFDPSAAYTHDRCTEYTSRGMRQALKSLFEKRSELIVNH